LEILPSPDIKMIFPVRRKSNTTHEELLAYWFAHHMPGTIALMGDVGRGYIGTPFKAAEDGSHLWDGIAQMFLAEPLATPPEGFGAKPKDSFHEHVQPYFGWATREYIFLQGDELLPVTPLTLNAPFPTSRSGFFKVTRFVEANNDIDDTSLHNCWLQEHAPNVVDAMSTVGGFRYVVGLSLETQHAPYLGMEELYFPDSSAWQRFLKIFQTNNTPEWIVDEGVWTFYADTEFVAIPP
jgi:hypothetical protein